VLGDDATRVIDTIVGAPGHVVHISGGVCKSLASVGRASHARSVQSGCGGTNTGPIRVIWRRWGCAEQFHGAVYDHYGSIVRPLTSHTTKRRVVETDDGVHCDQCGATTGLVRRFDGVWRPYTTPTTFTMRLRCGHYGVGTYRNVRAGVR
jgi:hypothetical protein